MTKAIKIRLAATLIVMPLLASCTYKDESQPVTKSSETVTVETTDQRLADAQAKLDAANHVQPPIKVGNTVVTADNIDMSVTNAADVARETEKLTANQASSTEAFINKAQ